MKNRYQPDPSTIYRVMGKFQDLTAEEKTAITLPVRVAFERMKSGSGTDDDFHCLADACNISIVCAEKIDALVESACMMARDALVRALERNQRTGRWGFDGPAISEISEMISIYSQLTDNLKPHQLQAAITEARKRTGAQA